MSAIVANGIIDARSRPSNEAFIEDRTDTNAVRTLANVAARGWTITPAIRSADLDGALAEADEAGVVHAAREVAPRRVRVKRRRRDWAHQAVREHRRSSLGFRCR